MKITLFQIMPSLDQLKILWQKIEAAVRKAKDFGSDLFILPEFFSTGFNFQMIKDHATSINSGSFAALSKIAEKNDIYMLGTHPEVRDGKIFNTAVMWDTKGSVIGTFAKRHLFSPLFEDRIITPGESIEIIDSPWAKIGLVICYDLRFPELSRQITLQGADMIIVPALWPQPRLDHWQILLQARAIENQIFVVGCNRASDTGKSNFGSSMVIDPEGKILAEAGSQEVLLHINLDIEKMKKIRKEFPVLNARQSGLYGSF